MAGPGDKAASPPTTTTSTTTTTVPVQPGWTPVTTGPHGVVADQRNVTEADGNVITVVRFRAGQCRFNLHIGSKEPPAVGVDLGPAAKSIVSATELPLLVAAFNGGFKVNAGVGGVEVGWQTLTPLVPGDASLVIDVDGTLRIGAWDFTVPVLGEHVYSVRQNLSLLLSDGQLSPQIGILAQWGSTLHGIPAPARSALGEDPAGDILFAAGMAALPIDLASALRSDGATTAMQLDINPEWVQLDLAPAAGGPLAIAMPGQNRPVNQYLVGWTRDFITVLART